MSTDPEPAVSAAPPSWASALRGRRLELAKSQERLVEDSGGTLNQSEVSRLERGLVHPTRDLGLERFFAYLRALEWNPREFEAATGVTLPFASEAEGEALEAASRLEVHPEWLSFPVRGSVAAGPGDGDDEAGEGVAYVPREKLRARGADPEHVRVYVVNGDCMISGEAQRVQKNIAPGDHIAVDRRRTPQPGDVVVAWWPEQEKMVVKRFRIEGKDIVLYPVNPGRPSLVLPDEDGVFIIGTVVWRGG